MSDEFTPVLDEIAVDTGFGQTEAPDGRGYLTHSFACEMRDLSDADKGVTVIVSTSKMARDGDILMSKGIDLRQFKKNPVVLWCHDYNALPVASSPMIKLDNSNGGRLIGRPIFHLETELSREVWTLVKRGVLRAWSLGFIPQRVKRLEEGEGPKPPGTDTDGEAVGGGMFGKYRITRAELVEYSSVPVPADAGALTQGIRALHEGGLSVPELERRLRSAGFEVPELVPAPLVVNVEIKAEDIEEPFVQMLDDMESQGLLEPELRVEEAEEFIHVPVRAKGTFRSSTLKTINISTADGISAVAGKLKTNEDADEDPMIIQKYLFAKNKDWTVETADVWVEEHKKMLAQAQAALQAKGFEMGDFEFVFIAGTRSFFPIPSDTLTEDALIERAGKTISKATARMLNGWAVALDNMAEGIRKLAAPQDEPVPEKKYRRISLEELRTLAKGR